MQPDDSHLIHGHKYSEEGWLLLDKFKDDHLQHHLRPETITYLYGCISSSNATHHNLLYSCKKKHKHAW